MDAALAAGQPSGVALVEQPGAHWPLIALASSYRSFTERVEGIGAVWSVSRFPCCGPDISEVLEAAERLGGQRPHRLTVEIPSARPPVASRRPSDRNVSRELNDRWCKAHSPTVAHDGALGAPISEALSVAGYELAITATPEKMALEPLRCRCGHRLGGVTNICRIQDQKSVALNNKGSCYAD